MSRRGRFLDKLKWVSRSPSPGSSGSFSDRFTMTRPRVERRNNTANQSISTSASQLSTVPSSILAQPQSSRTPRTTGGEVAAAFSGDHTPTSSSDVQGSSLVFISTPIVRVSHSQSELIEPVVWTKALKIARKKLDDNNLPPLDPTALTSQSAGKNIEAIVKGLKTLQEDDEKKRWSYTWHGKKVIVVEHLAKILRYVEKYSKVVDTAIQSQPEVSALVWAGVWGIMRVCI